MLVDCVDVHLKDGERGMDGRLQKETRFVGFKKKRRRLGRGATEDLIYWLVWKNKGRDWTYQ